MDKYILQLLKLHHKIILPDFGAIVIADEESGELMFNPFLNYEDTKLAEIVEQESNMNLQEAQNAVAKFIRELKYHLDKGNTYSIFQLGEFSKERDEYVFNGNIKTGKVTRKEEDELGTPFTPKPSVKTEEEASFNSTLSEVYEEKPAESVVIPSIALENEDSTPASEIVNTEEESTSNESSASIIEEERKDTIITKEEKNPKRKGIFGVLALISVLAIISLLLYNNKDWLTGGSKEEIVSHNEEEITTVDEKDVVQELIEEEEMTDKEEITYEAIEETNLSPSTIEPIVSNGNYHIVFGAFSEVTNAERAVKEMKNEGFNASVIGPISSKNLYYAAAESYSSEDDAKANLSRVSAIKSSAWIFKY